MTATGRGPLAALHVVVPGQGGRWQSGGLMIAMRAAELLDHHLPTDLVTSHDTDVALRPLDQAIEAAGPGDAFLVTWGPHVNDLTARLAGRRVIYYAQSGGWGVRPPPTVPILALSRALMGAWAEQAPHQPVNLLPPVLDPRCVDPGGARDIDVLFVARKSTPYLRDRLVPALADRCNVHVQEAFISRGELIGLYQRSKVYLYSSAPARYGVGKGAGVWVEGFGLQPLEARTCGCTVFSNLHGGLADYLEPEVNAFELETHSLAFDLSRILREVEQAPLLGADIEALQAFYSEGAFHERIRRILPALEAYFNVTESAPTDFGVASATAPASALAGVRRRLRRVVGGATP